MSKTSRLSQTHALIQESRLYIESRFQFVNKKPLIDCLVYEMFFINELKPTLSVQSDSIRAKVFNQLFTSFFFVCFYCLFTPAKKFLNLFKKILKFLILLTCISIFIIWRRVFYWELNHSQLPYATSSGTRVAYFPLSPL